MDPQTGRRFSYHDQAEPDFFSPQDIRSNGFRQRRRSRGRALGEAGPNLHIPNNAGRGYLGGHNPTRERWYGYAEEEDELEDEIDPHRHSQRRGRQQAFPRKHDRFGDHSQRPSQHDNTGARRQHEFAEDHVIQTRGARPGGQHATSQHHGGNYPVRDSFQDHEIYGSSRRGDGRGLRDRCEEAFGDIDAGAPRAMVGDCGIQIGGDSQEQEGRFVPYTFRMLQRKHVEFLARVFSVRTSKVKEWCERDFIRMDRMRDCETNIDPLLSTLTNKDREKYARAIQKIKNEKDIGDPVGWGPRHVPGAYERGFDYGRASVRREQGTGGHW